ncbi:hypothetical protein COMA2_50245 [Candidatus Nitrospira nitrificans]|uniref:Uncharacterized protein n=1 Tax=Candidatus Nitrospira nitrificans TaxID=1742973 RepID=A0A0S4LS60_9BACT|nr:hypothetical protein COMA2_50245 [Candidatus Nitrospira nitrificans]
MGLLSLTQELQQLPNLTEPKRADHSVSIE